MEKLNFESSLYLQLFTLTYIDFTLFMNIYLVSHTEICTIVPKIQNVIMFAFSQSPGIHYQSNKGYIGYTFYNKNHDILLEKLQYYG